MSEKNFASSIKEAIKEQDSGKLKKALADFKKWFFGGDPEAKHQGLKQLLLIMYMLLGTVVAAFSGYAIGDTLGDIAVSNLLGTQKKRVKWTATIITSLLSIFAVFKSNSLIIKEANKEQAKYIDEYISKAEKQLAKLEKELKKIEDTSSNEYKQALKVYKSTLTNLNWLKSRKISIENNKKIDSAKAAIKDAKKSGNKDDIRKAKDSYKAAKKALSETISILDIIDEEDSTMNENAILLKKAKALIEAVAMDFEDDVETTETVDAETLDAVNEAIDMLYEKAIMCESADDAALYVKKAEELQKAIEDIPEETPIKDNEYPAEDVTGGKGIMDDEAIKDLVDGDAEALKLLTSDVGSTMIDA